MQTHGMSSVVVLIINDPSYPTILCHTGRECVRITARDIEALRAVDAPILHKRRLRPQVRYSAVILTGAGPHRRRRRLRPRYRVLMLRFPHLLPELLASSSRILGHTCYAREVPRNGRHFPRTGVRYIGCISTCWSGTRLYGRCRPACRGRPNRPA